MYPLDLMRSWNRLCDRQFYDVDALTREEQARLSGADPTECGLIMVYPGRDRREILQYTPAEFLGDLLEGQLAVHTLVVPGVGCSALGTAALARNVADYTGEPACGLVSCMSMADMMAESMGGWYALGTRHLLREWIGRSLSWWGLDRGTARQGVGEGEALPEQFVPGSVEALVLLKILMKAGDRLRLLVGHSKGNFVIENAMEGYAAYCQMRTRNLADFMIVTLGAVVRLPAEATRVKQIIGGMDLFGQANSRLFVPSETILMASHSTNPNSPFPLIVAKALEVAGVPAKR